MTCDAFAPFVDAYVDGELDAQDRLEMEVHLAQCERCREQVAVQAQIKTHFKACLSDERAPEGLRARIFDQLNEIDSDESWTGLEVADSDEPRRRWLRRISMVAAPLAAAIALVVALPAFTVAPASSTSTPVVEQTIDWHRGEFPIEVTGPDAADVSRWFHQKVSFPVRPLAFSSEFKANLLGARLAHVNERRAAYLLYEVQGTRMSVLIFDGKGIEVPAELVREISGRDVFWARQSGYDVALLREDGLTYAVTSELGEEKFARLISSSSSR